MRRNEGINEREESLLPRVPCIILARQIPLAVVTTLCYATEELTRVIALTVFFSKEKHGRFAGPKKSGRNNEITVLLRWPYRGVPR